MRRARIPRLARLSALSRREPRVRERWFRRYSGSRPDAATQRGGRRGAARACPSPAPARLVLLAESVLGACPAASQTRLGVLGTPRLQYAIPEALSVAPQQDGVQTRPK